MRKNWLVSILVSVAVMVGAVGAMADDIFTYHVLVQNYTTGVASNFSGAWTNTFGEKVLVKRASIYAPTLSGGTMQSVQPIQPTTGSTTVTNDLPCTTNGTLTTLYFVPEFNSLWIEPAGKILFTASGSTTNVGYNFSLYLARPSR